MKKEGHNKLKIAVIISVISVLIAILSLIFSFYVSIKELEYNENSRQMQIISQELQKNSLEFEESYKKIELTQQSILDAAGSCNKINKEELDKVSKLLANARSALVRNDYSLVADYINLINPERTCYAEAEDNTFYWEIGILAFVWLVLIITFFMVAKKR